MAQPQAASEVLAPMAAREIAVPVTNGAVMPPGRAIATIGGGWFFPCLSRPNATPPI